MKDFENTKKCLLCGLVASLGLGLIWIIYGDYVGAGLIAAAMMIGVTFITAVFMLPFDILEWTVRRKNKGVNKE